MPITLAMGAWLIVSMRDKGAVMKILKIRQCGECPHCSYSDYLERFFCEHDRARNPIDAIGGIYIRENQRPPKWCPLPEEEK